MEVQQFSKSNFLYHIWKQNFWIWVIVELSTGPLVHPPINYVIFFPLFSETPCKKIRSLSIN